MSSIDNRVVKMQFDNATFKKEAIATKDVLTQVDAAVAKTGKGRGLLDMAGHMETVRVKAGAMQVAAVTAISNIANRAVDAGINIAKSFTLDPIKAGFDEYELKMKSIQTILANTKGENLKSVTLALNELNEYSDKTIYNFANMTENIGKLTTAGISLEDSTAVVKGFSNMVALAGGDATAAAGAMEQFGQGLQAGAIKAIDWMSISNRGLGSQNLQRAFFETARAAGALTDVPVTTTFEQWSKDSGGFKASLESGWLTTETATKTLKIMTGDVKSVQELVEQGFDPKIARDMLQIADSALDSATKVRTFTAFMDTTKEAIGSGWSQLIETVVGDFNESTALFTKLSTIVGNSVGRIFGYLSNLVKGWDEMGGRAAALKTIQHVLAPIGAILKLIAGSWKAAFGGTKTGKGLADMTKLAERLTRPLEVLAKMIEGSIGPLTAFFRLFSIGKNVIKDIAGDIIEFISGMVGLDEISFDGGGGILGFVKDVAREIGEAIKKVDDLIKKGASLRDALGSVDISLPKLPNLPDMAAMPKFDSGGLPDLNSIFSGFNTNGATSELDQAAASLSGVSAESQKAATVGDKVMPAVSAAWDTLRNFFKGFNIEDLMAAFNLAVLSTFAISLSKFMNSMSEGLSLINESAGLFPKLMEDVSGALGSFQTAARAQLITAIAIAIGILAASLFLLSFIPADKLVRSLVGLAALMIIVNKGIGGLADAVEKMEGKGAVFKLGALSVALIALGVAILLLATAFLILEKVDWSAMIKGIATIFVVMKTLESLGKVGENGAKNLLGAAVALGALSLSMVVLAGALMLFELVTWESMAKGGLVLGALALALGSLAKIPESSIAKVGLAMLAASAGFLAIANALLIFQLVSWESIAKGGVALLGLTAALAILQVVGNPVAISGLIGLGLGMLGLATAMLVLNQVNWESLAKAGVILLALIAAFALFMAVVYVAAPVLPLLSGLALSLALLAGALALLTIAVAAILPIMAIGVGAFAAFATGAAIAIGVFLTTLALQAPIMKKSILTLLQTFIDGIVEAVPMVIDGIKRLFAAIMKEFSNGGGGGKTGAAMGKAGDGWMQKLMDGIKKKLPGIVDKAIEIGKKFVDGLIKNASTIAAKGVELVVALINGLSSRADLIITAAANLIIKLAEGLQQNLNRIIDAGVQLIADFLHKLADTIRSGSAAIGGGIKDVLDAMRDVGVDIVKGLIAGIEAMFDDAMTAIGNLASGMVNKAKGILDIFSPSRVFKQIGVFLVEGLTNGIQENAASAITAVASMVGGQIAVASAYMSDFVQTLDQQAIAATAKAEGLTRAAATAARLAEKAANKADKTKGKGDDKKARKAGESAEKLQDRADRAEKAAAKAEARAQAAAEAEERKTAYNEADTFDKAKMRSEDAQSSMDAAKAAEGRAAASLAEAAALEKQAKADGVTKKQRKEMLKQAEGLRKQAEQQAKDANTQIANAQKAAQDALYLQNLAGDEAAAEFERRYADERLADERAEAFEGYSDEQKAADLRNRGNQLQAKADADYARARELAYTDLAAAQELFNEAAEAADASRDMIDAAEDYEKEIAERKKAADQAVIDFQANFDREAKEDADVAAFNKLSDAEKAVERRRQADELAAKAQADLAKAKELAYTDLQAANSLAQEANRQADLARQYLDEATTLETNVAQGSGAGSGNGSVVDLAVTDAAATAFNQYNDLYSSAAAAASAGGGVEFNQYNYSPEALNPSDIYRQTSNFVTFAAPKLQPTN